MRVACVAFVACVAGAACGAHGRPPAPPPARPRPTAVVAAVSSPGPLVAVHAGLTCNDCHVNSSAQLDNARCLGCHAHADLAARISTARGFHASAVVAGKPCAACHLDHRGASFDASGWSALTGGRDAFDHDRLTGWPLAGGHSAVACAGCHTRTTAQHQPTFLGTERLCGACHHNQPHGLVRRELLACERCHTQLAWRPARPTLAFNHDDRRDARMPLLGVHASVACVKCHTNAQFNLQLADPVACDGCHRGPHAGTIKASRRCAECHSPTYARFATTMFDHTERTRFDLGRSHARLACTACHSAALGTTPPSTACETCHASRNPHTDRFKELGAPPRCAACHRPSPPYDPKLPAVRPPWVPSGFDHTASGHWPLTGKHARITCRGCHRGSTPSSFEKLTPGADCMGCHEHVTVHSDPAHPNGQYTNQQCTQCHR